MEEDDRISRRRLIGTAGAGVLGASIAAAAEASDADAKARRKQKSKSKPKPKKHTAASKTHTAQVCVVGAGISGLNAARTLRAAGHSVIVLEARDRVGGRCYSVEIPDSGGAPANMGATFVGPTQTDVLALMSDLGIGKYPTYSTGDLLWYESGKLTRYNGQIPPTDNPLSAIQLGEIILPAVNQLAASCPTDAPYTMPNALSYDQQTAWTWVNSQGVTAEAAQLFDFAINALISQQSWDISMLYLIWYVAQAGNIQNLIGNAGTGAAQDYQVVGGTQNISVTMAEQLGIGKRVLLNNPVRRIDETAKGAVVNADNATVNCQQVIVAMSPTLTGQIVYEPQVTAARRQLVQRVGVGALIKTVAVYDEPFWRSEGLNAEVTSLTGPVTVMFDASPPSGSPGVLLGFVDGNDARTMDDIASPATRQSMALASYVTYFGSQAANPRFYVDQVWAQEIYSGGCPVGACAPGVLTEYGAALRAPIGRVHWAGTETATAWAGYMSGGVQAGARAAQEVMAAL